MSDLNPELLEYMRAAVDEAAACPDGRERIGVVLVTKDGKILRAHKFEDGSSGQHAEELLLQKAGAAGLKTQGATIFVTLEPCANLEGRRTPCADLLIAAGVSTVYIGRYDINFRINRQGWKRLTEAGVRCLDFPQDLRDELDELNAVFRGHFLGRTGKLTGVARFDWTTNGGRYELTLDDKPNSPTWTTSWGTCGPTSIYANGGVPGVVALARYATAFEQIDDPSAYDFGSHFAELDIGDIGIYRNEHGYALVQVQEVEPPAPYGTKEHVSVKFAFELRRTVD